MTLHQKLDRQKNMYYDFEIFKLDKTAFKLHCEQTNDWSTTPMAHDYEPVHLASLCMH